MPASGDKVILIAGMHRCGTSALTRVLNRLGAALPEPLVAPAIGNELGHWEPAEVVALNDRALLAAGGDVNSVFPVSETWLRSDAAEGFVEEIEAYLTSRPSGPSIIAIKDPRISVLASLWRKALERLEITPRFLIGFRDPSEVASSLTARQLRYFPDEVWPPERAKAIWLSYVLSVERASRGVLRSFVDYETLLEDWSREIGRVYAQLDLGPFAPDAVATEMIDAFVRPEERHARKSVRADPDAIEMRVQRLLLDRQVDPEGGAGAFDKIGATLTNSTVLYGEYVQRLEARVLGHGLQDGQTGDRLASDGEVMRALHVARLRGAPERQEDGAPASESEARMVIGSDAEDLAMLRVKHEGLRAAHFATVEALQVAADEVKLQKRAVRQAQAEQRKAHAPVADLQARADDLAERNDVLSKEIEETRAAYESLRLEVADLRREASKRDLDSAVEAERRRMIDAVRQDRQGPSGASTLARRVLARLRRSRLWLLMRPVRARTARWVRG